MNVLVVDTSSWVSYFKGKKNDDLDLALQEGRVYLPPVVVAELMSANISPQKRIQLREFLQELPLCQSDFAHWIRVGTLRSGLLKKGYAMSTPDAHIAQCVLDLNGYLVSEDRIFDKVAKQLSLRRI